MLYKARQVSKQRIEGKNLKKAYKTFHVHFLSRNKKRTKEMRPLLSFM